MKASKDSAIIQHYLNSLEMPAKALTDWELARLREITDIFVAQGYLSERQFEVLERIYTDKA